MQILLKSLTLLCLSAFLVTNVQAQNVGNLDPNTSAYPTRIGIGTTNPDNRLHVYTNTYSAIAQFEQAASNGRDGGIYIKGARNNCTTCEVAYITLANFDDNYGSIGKEYAMARISGGMDLDNTKAGHIKFKVNNGTSLIEAMRINHQGKMRVGSVSMAPNGYKLFVEEGILTEKVKVALNGTANWSDYVFAPDYKRNSIEEVAHFIDENQHLPNVPSAEEVVKNGIDLAKMDATLLRQIEELWLHMIDMKKTNEQLIEKNQQLSKEIEVLKSRK